MNTSLNRRYLNSPNAITEARRGWSSKSLLGLPSFCGNRAFLDPRVTTNQCPHDSDHDLKNRRLFLTTTTLKIAEYRSNMGAIWSIKVRKIWRHLATFPCINSQRHLFTSYTVDMQRHDTPPIQLVGSYSIGWALHTHTHTHTHTQTDRHTHTLNATIKVSKSWNHNP